MTKQEITSIIAANTCLNKSDIVGIVDEFMAIVKREVSKGNNVTLRNFGTFQQITRNDRNFHYAPGKFKFIPKHNEPFFRPSNTLKDAVK